MIKGFIFDLDGTLTLTQLLHHQALQQVFAEYGINYTQKEDQEKYSGKGSKHTCERVLTEAGKNPTPEDIEKCAEKKKKILYELLETTGIKTVPGVMEFLTEVHANGIKMIVATGNKIETTEKILEKAGIRKFFEKFVAQQDVKNQKPAPDIFLLAAKKLELAPNECMVFEDSPNGVKAAKAGNFKCIALTTGSPATVLKENGADATINDYTDPELKKLI